MTARRVEENRCTAPTSEPDTLKSRRASIAPAEVPVGDERDRHPDMLTGAVLLMFAVAVGGLSYQAVRTMTEPLPLRATATLATGASYAGGAIEAGVDAALLDSAQWVDDLEIVAEPTPDSAMDSETPATVTPRAIDAMARMATVPAERRPTGLAEALRPEPGPFDAANADAAMLAARTAALDCGERGWARVAVTFALSGLTTSSVTYDGDLVGTEVGGCIAKRMRAVQIAPFSGPAETVTVTVSLLPHW
jgi:hypothetical protein